MIEVKSDTNVENIHNSYRNEHSILLQTKRNYLRASV